METSIEAKKNLDGNSKANGLDSWRSVSWCISQILGEQESPLLIKVSKVAFCLLHSWNFYYCLKIHLSNLFESGLLKKERKDRKKV
jgi:hypothetical protein